MSLSDVAAAGDRLDTLRALRDLLADSIERADPEKRAPLAARLTDVLEQIAALSPEAKEGDPVDEIAQRRAARGAGSPTASRSASTD